MDNRKWKVVLFDLDGTLIDSSEGITKSAQYCLDYYGIHEEDLDKLRVFIGPPLVYSFPKYYGFEGPKIREAVDKYRERYNKIGIFECALYPGAEDCLKKLKDNGYIICLASSKPEGACRRILDHFGITELFDEIVGSTPDGRIDTKQQVLEELFSRTPEVNVDEMVLVGDTIFDVEGANKVNLSTIGVDYGFGNVDEMKAAGAVSICSSLMEVADYIMKAKN